MLNLSLKQLFFCNSYLGYSKKNWNKEMSLFVIGSRYDLCFLKLNYTYFLLKKIFNILSNLNLRKQSIFLVVPEYFKNYLIKDYFYKLNKNFINIAIINKWVYGTITNFKKIQYSIDNYIYSNSYKQLPSVLIIINENNLSIVQESLKFNILSLGLVDTRDNPYSFDYFSPSNLTSYEVLVFFFKFFLIYIYLLNLKYKFGFFNNSFKKYKRYINYKKVNRSSGIVYKKKRRKNSSSSYE